MPQLDGALIERCQQDDSDEGAFRDLYHRHAAGVYRHLAVLLGPGADAEDALQEVFTRAFGSIRKYDGRASFPAWLRGFTDNIALNARRSWKRRINAMRAAATEPEPVPSPTPESLTATGEQTLRINHHLQALSPEERTAFAMYYVEQFKIAEVAKALNMSETLAWARIRRSRAKLLEALAGDEQHVARRTWSAE